jgi:chemotaxis family two-component system response regulator Rcp1
MSSQPEIEKKRSAEILLVEDNPADVRLVQETLKEGALSVNLRAADDVADALRILRGQDQYAGTPRPDIILLDLNLPKSNILELFTELSGPDGRPNIPVIALTTSDAEHELIKANGIPVTVSITKPIGLDDFVLMIKSIEDNWL